MNKALLHKNVQQFINRNFKEDIPKIVLAGSPFEEVNVQELAIQLAGKKKAEKKLPTWFKTEGIIYPPTVNIEQTSSEITAAYKASLIGGEKLADITGGFGVDSYYFSKNFKQVDHCEIAADLSDIATHNIFQLNVANIKVHQTDGISFLVNHFGNCSWIYVDPSRRDNSGGRVFHLSKCLPNVPEQLELLFSRSPNIMLKTSPWLDLKAGISALNGVREIHIVAVSNEVKELLWLLEKDYSEEISITTINFRKRKKEIFEGIWNETAEAFFSTPLTYLYEPNAALMKSRLFNQLGSAFGLAKLHPDSHLFTSEDLTDFPGRKFRISEHFHYNKKQLRKLMNFRKANITTRNFPESVQNLRKKLRIKEGGDIYMFFTTTEGNNKVVLVCKKIE